MEFGMVWYPCDAEFKLSKSGSGAKTWPSRPSVEIVFILTVTIGKVSVELIGYTGTSLKLTLSPSTDFLGELPPGVQKIANNSSPPFSIPSSQEPLVLEAPGF